MLPVQNLLKRRAAGLVASLWETRTKVRISTGDVFLISNHIQTSSGVHFSSISMCKGILSRSQNGRSVTLTIQLHLVQRLRMSGDWPLLIPVYSGYVKFKLTVTSHLAWILSGIWKDVWRVGFTTRHSRPRVQMLSLFSINASVISFVWGVFHTQNIPVYILLSFEGKFLKILYP